MQDTVDCARSNTHPDTDNVYSPHFPKSPFRRLSWKDHTYIVTAVAVVVAVADVVVVGGVVDDDVVVDGVVVVVVLVVLCVVGGTFPSA